ncbi:MAG: hypothetical protein JKY34_09015, partial [Kordiimonadaceae bacterium]|nr:hypothetical protein [Kordiimonadaceae bacterium]
KEYYNNLTNQPCIGIFERTLRRPSGGEDRIKILHFPLLDGAGKANIFIGVLITEHMPLNIDTLNNPDAPFDQDVTTRYIDIGGGTPNTSSTKA